jgi:cytoskeletal protein RodZ
MATVADQLRTAREAKNLTIYQVAEITKIRTDHVRALDEGNYDVFSAPVYIRGFVRTYAGVLKLDVPQVLEQLSQELAQSDKHHQPPRLGQRSPGVLDWFMFQLSQVNWRIVLPLVVVVLVITGSVWGYRAWLEQRNRVVDLGPALYQPPPEQQGEILPLPR